MRASLSLALPALAILLASTGCDRARPDAQPALDWLGPATSQVALETLVWKGAANAGSAEQAAAEAANDVRSKLGACVTAEVSGMEVNSATVHYVFSSCEGPYGLTALSGPLDVTYSIQPGGAVDDFVKITLSGGPLTAAGAKIEASGRAANNTARATWPNHGPDANNWLDHVGPQTALLATALTRFDDTQGCSGELQPLRISAVGNVLSNGTAYPITAVKVRRCGDRCPDAGGELQMSDPAHNGDLAWRITFDGTSQAQVFTNFSGAPGGADHTLALACRPASAP
jgi:hypothetical protein